VAKKSATDQQIEDLQAYIAKERMNDPAFRREFAGLNPGIPLPPREHVPGMPGVPGSDAANPFTGDEAGPASLDANGINAVDARDVGSLDEDDLDALNASVVDMVEATKARDAADKLRKGQPQSDAAIRQAAADRVQTALGAAQNISNVTQSGVRDRVFSAADRIGAAATPGGIGALVVIALLLLLMLIPVNGQPRLVWLWLVLVRRARLMSESEAAALSGGTIGGSEAAASNATESSSASFSAASILALNSGTANGTANGATYANSKNVASPVNIASGLLSDVTSALDRYINP